MRYREQVRHAGRAGWRPVGVSTPPDGALPFADPRRRRLREELVLAFLPVVEHLARRANPVTASAEELTQVGTIALITAIDRWDPRFSRCSRRSRRPRYG